MHAIGMARHAWGREKCRPEWFRVCRRILNSFRRAKDDEVIEKYVLREMAKRCVSRAQFCFKLGGRVLCLWSLPLIMNRFYDRPMSFSLGQDIIHSIYLLAALIVACVPVVVRPATLNAWYFGLSLGALAFCISSTDTNFLTICWLSFVPRLVFAWVSTGYALIVFANSIHVSVVSVVYSCTVLGRNPDGLGTLDFVVLEASFTVILTMFGCGWQAFTLAETRREALAKSSLTAGSATKRLLTLMCDVVLELDQDLRFAEHVPKFGVMFTLGASQCLRGKRMHDFMPIESDRERWESLTRQAPVCMEDPLAGDAPGVMHATMRASEDSKLSVEIFYVKYRDLNGAHRYLVGIHEVVDQDIPDLRKFRSSPPRRSSSGRGTRRGASGETRRETSANSSETSSARSSRSAPSEQERGMGATPSGAGHRMTSDAAKDVTMLSAMMSWRLLVPNASCCLFHASVRDAKRVVARLDRSRCKPEYAPVWQAQCTACGVFCPWDDEVEGDAPQRCDICQSQSISRLRAGCQL